MGASPSDPLPNLRAPISTRRTTTAAPEQQHYKVSKKKKRNSFPVFSCCFCRSAMCAPSVPPRAGRTSRRTDVHLFLCFSPPSDRRRYEAGTGLRVPAALRAPWRRVELQALCFRPHTPHTLHAGGGDDQLVVVCMSFLSVYLTPVCLQVIQPVKIGRNFQMSHFPECSSTS